MKLRKPLDNSLGLESINVDDAREAVTEVELEHCWFAQLVDIGELEKADHIEEHEQWNARCEKTDGLPWSGSVRVRKITNPQNGLSDYVLTLKNYLEGKRGCLETEFLVNSSVFKAIRKMAPFGMIKTRYTFDIPGTNCSWEIDVFDLHHGAWVKIDLEVDDPNFKIPPFPIRLENVLNESTPKKQFLMDSFFLTPNPEMDS